MWREDFFFAEGITAPAPDGADVWSVRFHRAHFSFCTARICPIWEKSGSWQTPWLWLDSFRFCWVQLGWKCWALRRGPPHSRNYFQNCANSFWRACILYFQQWGPLLFCGVMRVPVRLAGEPWLRIRLSRVPHGTWKASLLCVVARPEDCQPECASSPHTGQMQNIGEGKPTLGATTYG